MYNDDKISNVVVTSKRMYAQAQIVSDHLHSPPCNADRSGARGTVIQCSAGAAEAGVVFDGQHVEGCERIPVCDLEVVGAGFQADPDTPAQPVIAQLLSLLRALLGSEEVAQALRTTDAEELRLDVPAMAWSRLLSQTLVAILQLSVHCNDALVAACQEGDVVAKVLPMLLQVAIRPIQLPTLVTAQVIVMLWYCDVHA